jgi:hypothetical protein
VLEKGGNDNNPHHVQEPVDDAEKKCEDEAYETFRADP